MKRVISVLIVLVIGILSSFPFNAFTVSDSRELTFADGSGAYRINFSGRHADVTRYALGENSVGIDLFYEIGAVCAYEDHVIFFCDDTRNDQTVVSIYDADTGSVDSFALFGRLLYGDTDFCCDGDWIYVESYRSVGEISVYSFDGTHTGTLRFLDSITSLTPAFDGGAYAVCAKRLYRLSAGSCTEIPGAQVSSPLFSAGEDVLLSAFGQAYVLRGDRIVNSFEVDTDGIVTAGCVIGNRVYYPCSGRIYGYDLSTGMKVCYYDCGDFDALYAVGNTVHAVNKSTGNRNVIPISRFTEFEPPDQEGGGPEQGIGYEIASDAYRIDWTNFQISRIPPETSVAAFRSKMKYSGYSMAVYKDAAERKSGNVGTAMTAVFSSGSGSITFELSVDGDLTGEGNRNSRDLTIVMDYLIGAADFNGVYTIAADLSDDGIVDTVDLALFIRSI